jgi:hypothetical protein
MLDAVDDLNNRVRVWSVLQEFYLDNDMPDHWMDRLAASLARSPYTTKELDHIMFREVWPGLSANLRAVVGEWRPWSDDYLVERILERRLSATRVPWWLHFGKLLSCWKWFAVRRKIEQLRAAERGEPVAGP